MELEDAIRVRGLQSLNADTQEESIRRAVNRRETRTLSIDNFDPLTQAYQALIGNFIEQPLAFIYVMRGVCPICFVVKEAHACEQHKNEPIDMQTWLQQAAEEQLNYWKNISVKEN